MIKAIFLDIDGTLVSHRDYQVPISAIRALQEAKDKGVLLFTATGRHKSEIVLPKEIEFDGYVTLNGSYCTDKNGCVLYERLIPEKDVKDIIRLCEQDNVACKIFEAEEVYYNRLNQRVKDYYDMLNVYHPVVRDHDDIRFHNIYQLTALVSPQEEADFLGKISGITAARFNPFFFDMSAEGGHKGLGIEKILDHYRISIHDCLAIGDGENDIEMLKYVPHSVAMGNASDRVKRSARFVTKHIDDHGLAHALYEFGVVDRRYEE